MNIEEKFEDWQYAKERLDHFKKSEMSLRIELNGEIFKGQMTKGNEKREISGCLVTFKNNTALKLDVDILEEIKGDLNEDQLACVKYKPDLVKSKISKLEEDDSFFECVMESPSAPTMSFKEI